MKGLKISKKEVAKVTHDINNVWHERFQGKRVGVIETHSNRSDSPSYEYIFVNHDFDNYEFLGKNPTSDRR